MKTVYILTDNLTLYSDTGFFFSTLQKCKNISSDELLDAFPYGSITAHLELPSAESAVRQARKMATVEDENPHNQEGFTMRSEKTPVVLQVQLINDLNVAQNANTQVITRSMIDLTIDASVIHFEKGFKGNIPATLSMANLDVTKRCIIS